MPVSAAHPVRRQHGPHTRGDLRGLEVSPRGILQYQLVQRQVRDSPRRSRAFSASSSFNRLTWSPSSPPYSLRQR